MNDALTVCRLEGHPDLLGDRQRVFDRRSGRAAMRSAQRRASDQLEDQRETRRRLLDAVDRGRCWMVERRKDLRFALEARKSVGSSEGRRQDLERDLAVSCASRAR